MYYIHTHTHTHAHTHKLYVYMSVVIQRTDTGVSKGLDKIKKKQVELLSPNSQGKAIDQVCLRRGGKESVQMKKKQVANYLNI